MSNCLFCGIAAGRRPASIVYRDQACLAIMDIRPISPGHLLVFPVSHAADLSELDPADGAALFEIGRRIATELRKGALAHLGVRCDGVSLFLSDGAAAGQVVGHVHLHVVPRYHGDGAGFRRGVNGSSVSTRTELMTLASALASQIRYQEVPPSSHSASQGTFDAVQGRFEALGATGLPSRSIVSPRPSGERPGAAKSFVAFDLEIAKPFPSSGDWRDVRPMGITCAATLEASGELRVWHGPRQSDGRLAAQMSPGDCQDLARALLHWHAQGYTVVSWNGLGFDFDILVEECGPFAERERVVQLALDHTDIAFAMLCERGFMISLDSAAKGMGLSGKLPGMRAELAPAMWAQGAEEQNKVLDYVAQDVRTTADVFQAARRLRSVEWYSKSGKLNSWRLPGGRILPVSEALRRPEPDTSWMSRPWSRSRFYGWTGRAPDGT